jgi:uncharacterized protein (DUF362 family)/NAD-dependent dihydropyrimidine dehydrogenase PreA subunit
MSSVSVPVSIVKCEAYDEDLVYRSLKAAVDHVGGMDTFVAKGQTILLKPNAVAGRPPEKCVTTHPLVVKAVARLVAEAGATPLIGDSPQVGPVAKTVAKCGIQEVAKDLGVDIVEFEPITVNNPGGKVFRTLTIGKIVTEVDGVINIAKIKTHALMCFTLSVKNMFGCVPGARKAQWHVKTYEAGTEYLAQVLLDLYYYVKPVLNIVDGVVGMEGMGPGFGEPRHVGVLVAGPDGVAVDRVICEMLGVRVSRVPILDVALREGYGVGNLEDINIVGERLEDVKVADFKLALGEELPQKILKRLKGFLRTYLTTQPLINQETCEACEMCCEACPLNCIGSESGTLKINKDICIQCLCCMEICPHGAIDLRPGGLLRAYQKVNRIFRAA